MSTKAKPAMPESNTSFLEKQIVYLNTVDEQRVLSVENGEINVEDIIDVTWQEYVEQGLKAHAFNIYGVELHNSMLLEANLPVILATKFDSSRKIQGEEKLPIWYRISFDKSYVIRRLALAFGEAGIFQNNTSDELAVCAELAALAQSDYFEYVRTKSVMDARSLAIQAAAKLGLSLGDYLSLITSIEL